MVLTIIALCGFFLVASSIEAEEGERYIRMLVGVSLLVGGFCGLAVLFLSYKYLWTAELISPLVLILPTICFMAPKLTNSSYSESIEAG